MPYSSINQRAVRHCPGLNHIENAHLGLCRCFRVARNQLHETAVYPEQRAYSNFIKSTELNLLVVLSQWQHRSLWLQLQSPTATPQPSGLVGLRVFHVMLVGRPCSGLCKQLAVGHGFGLLKGREEGPSTHLDCHVRGKYFHTDVSCMPSYDSNHAVPLLVCKITAFSQASAASAQSGQSNPLQECCSDASGQLYTGST